MSGHSGKRGSLILFAGAALVMSTGCSHLKVNSSPPGATVIWSSDGTTNWNPWPPRVWGGSDPRNYATPMSDWGRFGDTVWITVEKEGYYRPLPKPVQLYMFRGADLDFELEETPFAYAQRMEAEGLVNYNGVWVDPQEEGLAEFRGRWMPAEQAFESEQREKGLVPYEGEWLTAAEANSRFESAQLAKGLVKFKDRWMTPEGKATEEAIDERVLSLAAEEPMAQEPPKVIGRIEADLAQVQLLNSTSQTIRFLMSGPSSREVILGPYESMGLHAGERLLLLPGRYNVVILPEAVVAEGTQAPEGTVPSVPKHSFVEQPLAAGFQYLFSYDAGSEVELGEAEDYKLEDLKLPFDVPQIEIPEVELPEKTGTREEGGGRRGPRGPRF